MALLTNIMNLSNKWGEGTQAQTFQLIGLKMLKIQDMLKFKTFLLSLCARKLTVDQ